MMKRADSSYVNSCTQLGKFVRPLQHEHRSSGQSQCSQGFGARLKSAASATFGFKSPPNCHPVATQFDITFDPFADSELRLNHIPLALDHRDARPMSGRDAGSSGDTNAHASGSGSGGAYDTGEAYEIPKPGRIKL